MTETPESRTEPAAVATGRPNRLNQVAAWVGIIAGVVSIVAVIFFSGFFIGKHSGGYFGRGHCGDGYGTGQYGGTMGPGMMGPGGMTGPGQIGPGQQQSPTTTPAVPSSPRP